MFVVKRAFRDASGMVPAGSIVEPAGIKRFRHRLLEGHIVEVNEHNFDKYTDFFKQRYGIDLPPLKQPVAEQKMAAQPKVATPVAAKPTEAKKVVAAVTK
jgi:hypothetical protein|nr:MAG TPA_asm: methyltransferase [Caudoviricetes sp.]